MSQPHLPEYDPIPSGERAAHWVAGFMSGTSLDGVDVALIKTDGETVFEFGPAHSVAFSAAERQTLAAATQEALDWNWADDITLDHSAALEVLHDTHLRALNAVMDAAGRRPELLGIHGQTILHKAPSGATRGRTLQIFDAERFFSSTQIPLVYDFRSADIAAGGQGAPLAPAYHGALLSGQPAQDVRQTMGVLNLGGVANISWRDPDGHMIACDTGPANGPIDEWVTQNGLGNYDKDGALAASGHVDQARLAQWLSKDWFDIAPPKSLDRYDFSAALAKGMTPADGAATLTAFCAACVARSFDHLPHLPDKVIVCGGGRLNPTLMQELCARLPCEVLAAEAVGWRGDSIEAEAFGLLAVRHVRSLPLSWPLTTGVKTPMCGGVRIGVIK